MLMSYHKISCFNVLITKLRCWLEEIPEQTIFFSLFSKYEGLDAEALRTYSDPDDLELRAALGRFFGLDTENIFPGSGVDYLGWQASSSTNSIDIIMPFLVAFQVRNLSLEK